MKKEMRRSGAQINYTQRNYMQGNHHKKPYSRQKNQQYRELSSGYYMYTANAVARDYQYEEEQQPVQKVKKTKVKSRPALTQHISTVFIVFLLGLALVGQYTIVQSLGYQVSQSKTELKTVQDQNEKSRNRLLPWASCKTWKPLPSITWACISLTSGRLFICRSKQRRQPMQKKPTQRKRQIRCRRFLEQSYTDNL